MMELIGTALFVATIQIVSSPLAPFTIGLVLVALVYAGAPVSGAHYNPAITFSVFLRGKISLNEMLMYWVFQIGGGVAGALLGGIIGGGLGAVTRGEDVGLLRVFLAEVLFTGMLCFVVLAVATNSKTDGNQFFGGKS